jgi:glycosyltransferase involved in cell wall biosynthesis
VLLGLNHPYGRVDAAEARARLAPLAGVPWTQPFLLHVGSNLARKNKAGVLRVFARVAAEWPGNLVFAGAALTDELRGLAAQAGLAERVFAAPGLSNAQLEAAYGLALALLYPSRCEGFGWPVIEAQACGCPVICSDRTSLPEVGGDGALVHALEDEAGMADSVRRLLRPDFRAAQVARGTANLARVATDGMIDAYVAVYEEVAAHRPR